MELVYFNSFNVLEGIRIHFSSYSVSFKVVKYFDVEVAEQELDVNRMLDN